MFSSASDFTEIVTSLDYHPSSLNAIRQLSKGQWHQYTIDYTAKTILDHSKCPV